MIYSRFGTTLLLVSKTAGTDGRVRVQATMDGTSEVHEYDTADLKADDGLTEINATVAALPARVLEDRARRRREPLSSRIDSSAPRSPARRDTRVQ